LKILILKPSALGDVVQALPVARLLKQSYPTAQIHWWVAEVFAPLLEGDPDLAAVHRFRRKGWGRLSAWRHFGAMMRELRRERFDWVIDLQGLARSAVVAWLARGGLTVGVDSGREGARAAYDRLVPRPEAAVHAVDWYKAVVRALDADADAEFEWLPEQPEVAAAVRESWPALTGEWAVVCPGGRWRTKLWPEAHFHDLIRQLLAEQPGLRVAVMGDKADAAVGGRLAAVDGERCLDLTGKTSLKEMIEWLRSARVVITNDTGPMHVAAALGRPVVAVFGPTDPQRTGPYHAAGEVLRLPLDCSPCLSQYCFNPVQLECLWSLSPRRVLAAVRPWLADACG